MTELITSRPAGTMDSPTPSAAAERGLFPVVIQHAEAGAEGIRVLELAHPDGRPLPSWAPGAHIDVYIDEAITRQYSLCGDPQDLSTWRIGVLREPESRGGSEAIHAYADTGRQLWVGSPRNNFPLVDADRYVFIAGGIGITPLIPMIRSCHREGKPWRLVYGGRSLSSMAFVEELRAWGEHVQFWPQEENGHIDLAGILGGLEEGTGVYSCGPGPLLDALDTGFRSIAAGHGCTLHVERFRPAEPAGDEVNSSFTVVCDYSDVEVVVEAEESILDALSRVGISVPSSCREGTCGTCETVVLEGLPDHRDSYLTAPERESNEVMTPCCSRSKTPVIVLDL